VPRSPDRVHNERVNLGITDPPTARRGSSPGWRAPRLWVGLAIVAASVLVGALVLGPSDDTVPVWAVNGSLGAGHALTADDLAVRRVHLEGSDVDSLYFRADEQLPADLRLSREIGAGELLPRAAVAPVADRDLRQVPVSVSPDQVPGSVGVGDAVDVYVRPATHTGCADSSVCDGRPALSGVTVVDAPPSDEAFGSDGTRMLVLGMSGVEARRFFRLLASTDDAALTVVGRG
jgi:hypothetical protein